MGLAEPRKRIKISHDPRNLSWLQNSSSYGQKLMQKQGWKAGQSLGSRTNHNNDGDASRTQSATIGILFKDDTLGLGARGNKTEEAAIAKTGSDAFAGLLGRLNGSTTTDVEVKEMTKKIEDRKLAMWAQGRWGGVLFVPGGLLVQGDEYQKKREKDEAGDTEKADEERREVEKVNEDARETKEERRKRRKQKEERRARKGIVRGNDDKAEPVISEDILHCDSGGTSKSKIRDVDENSSPPSTAKKTGLTPETIMLNKSGFSDSPEKRTTQPSHSNGRHLLRVKNIQAKRMAFLDSRGLDEIFMTRS